MALVHDRRLTTGEVSWRLGTAPMLAGSTGLSADSRAEPRSPGGQDDTAGWVGRGEAVVGRDQRAAPCRGERDVQAVENPDAILEIQGTTQLPDVGNDEFLFERHGIGERGPGGGRSDITAAHETGERREDLGALVGRRNDRLIEVGEHLGRRRLVEHHVDERRSIEHDHVPNSSRAPSIACNVSSRRSTRGPWRGSRPPTRHS